MGVTLDPEAVPGSMDAVAPPPPETQPLTHELASSAPEMAAELAAAAPGIEAAVAAAVAPDVIAVTAVTSEVETVAAKVAVALHVQGVVAGESAEPEPEAEAERDEAVMPPPPMLAGRDRVEVLGCALDRVTLDDAVAYCESVIATRGFAQHMAINAAKLVAMRHDDELRESIDRCELITADGQSIVWASQLLGHPLPGRVAGIDLMQALLARAANKGYRVYVLGATEEVLTRAVERMRSEYPTLTIAGYHDGYYAEADEPAIAAQIAESAPDMLFVAMSSPRKEYFLARHGRTINVPFVMGVGGSIDVYAGLVKRAPVPIQRMGLEWAFRLAQEPRRLLGRYARTNTQFVALLAREVLRGRRREGAEHAVA